MRILCFFRYLKTVVDTFNWFGNWKKGDFWLKEQFLAIKAISFHEYFKCSNILRSTYYLFEICQQNFYYFASNFSKYSIFFYFLPNFHNFLLNLQYFSDFITSSLLKWFPMQIHSSQQMNLKHFCIHQKNVLFQKLSQLKTIDYKHLPSSYKSRSLSSWTRSALANLSKKVKIYTILIDDGFFFQLFLLVLASEPNINLTNKMSFAFISHWVYNDSWCVRYILQVTTDWIAAWFGSFIWMPHHHSKACVLSISA